MKARRLADLCELLAALALLAAVTIFCEPRAARPRQPRRRPRPSGRRPLRPGGRLHRPHRFAAGRRRHHDRRQKRGTTPFLGNVACSQGEKVKIEIELAGFAPWRRELECRENGQLTVDAKLSK